jgi:peroxiredoxin
MIADGNVAPEFTLPAVVDGSFEEIGLANYLGDDIVILAFYPADFNPACSDEETDLDELDLFTMQKDVSILGISADSVYSHRAFADEYDLHIPLLADVHAEVATDYGVATADDTKGHLTNRAVVVIDPGGEVQYAWQTDDLTRLPPVEQVREAVDDIGGSSTAEARYRVGHAHYVEGRRAFTKAMGGFKEREWMMAQGDFTRAQEEFEEAADQFNTAARFAEDEEPLRYFERAEEKAQSLWQAAEWLAESASAYASGEGAEGESMRTDAERPLETARDIHEPPDPDDFPPDEDPADIEEGEERSILPEGDDGPPAALETDIDDAAETPEAEALADEMGSGDPTPAEDSDTTAESGPVAGATEHDKQDADGADEDTEADEIDDEELEEIAAELEEQTQQAKKKREREAEGSEDESSIVEESPTDTPDDGADFSADPDESPDGTVEDPDETRPGDSADPDAEDVEGELDEEDIELDLADPTEGTDMEPDEPADVEDEDENGDETDEDLSSGSHGVPDSL